MSQRMVNETEQLADEPAQARLSHGKRSSYVGGCRCEGCTAANADYQRGLRRRRVAEGAVRIVHGRWVYLADTAPARKGS